MGGGLFAAFLHAFGSSPATCPLVYHSGAEVSVAAVDLVPALLSKDFILFLLGATSLFFVGLLIFVLGLVLGYFIGARSLWRHLHLQLPREGRLRLYSLAAEGR